MGLLIVSSLPRIVSPTYVTLLLTMRVMNVEMQFHWT